MRNLRCLRPGLYGVATKPRVQVLAHSGNDPYRAACHPRGVNPGKPHRSRQSLRLPAFGLCHARCLPLALDSLKRRPPLNPPETPPSSPRLARGAMGVFFIRRMQQQPPFVRCANYPPPALPLGGSEEASSEGIAFNTQPREILK